MLDNMPSDVTLKSIESSTAYVSTYSFSSVVFTLKQPILAYIHFKRGKDLQRLSDPKVIELHGKKKVQKVIAHAKIYGESYIFRVTFLDSTSYEVGA